MPGLAQESKNNASFRFFAVEKGRVAERVPGREKTGMTVVRVVCNERRWYIFVAPKAPLLSGEVPEEAWALRAISLTINYEFCLLPRGALCSGLGA